MLEATEYAEDLGSGHSVAQGEGATSHRQRSLGGLVTPTRAHSGTGCLLEGLSLTEGTSIEWGWVGAGPCSLLPASAASIRAG